MACRDSGSRVAAVMSAERERNSRRSSFPRVTMFRNTSRVECSCSAMLSAEMVWRKGLYMLVTTRRLSRPVHPAVLSGE